MNQERAEDESLFKAKKADRKQKHRGQERTKEESLFKRKQKQTEKSTG